MLQLPVMDTCHLRLMWLSDDLTGTLLVILYYFVDRSKPTPGVLSDARNDITEAIIIPVDNVTTRMELPGNPHPARLNTRRMHNDEEVSGNESAFCTVQRRRLRDRAVFGTGDDDALSAGLQRHDLFVFQINKESTENDIKSYLER